MIGKFVYHKRYGKGQVTNMVGNYNYFIQFDNQKKEMIFPADSFTDEYFILDENEIKKLYESNET